MLNYVWLGLILISVIVGACRGTLSDVVASIIDSAQTSFDIALGLVAIMALWLGLMKIAEDADLIKTFAQGLLPVMRKLFPEVPEDHPAMGAMVMNIAANMLGVGNAATPFGLRAMEALDSLNPLKGTATNAMCMFLAINTSSVQLIPATAIAYLAAAGSTQPTRIIVPVLIATTCSTLAAIIAAKWLEKQAPFRLKDPPNPKKLA